MNMRTFTGCLSAALMAVGCGADTSQAVNSDSGGAANTCATGNERCACFSSGTCGQGLTCLSGLCVSGATGGASSNGGANGLCAAGSERCACYGNKTCDNGLECRSDLCVAAATGGATAVGGSSGSGGLTASFTGAGGVQATGGASAGGSSFSSLGGTAASGGISSTGGKASSISGNASAGGTSNGPTGGAVGTGGLTAVSTGNGGVNATGGANAGGSNTQSLTVVTQDMWDRINSASCMGWSGAAEWVPTNIEFVVDTSGSMSDVAKNTNDGRSKWEITETTLSAAIDALPQTTRVGLLLWPNKMTVPNSYTVPYQGTGGVNDCVNVSAMLPLAMLGAQGSSQRKTIASALGGVTPKGGTPMADAYNYAVEQNFGISPMMSGSKSVVLITDGQPTIQLGCMGTGEERHPVAEQPVLDSITSVYDTSFIKTFVIGSPGSESQSMTGTDGRSWLSAAARAGGTPRSSTCEDSGGTSKLNFCHFDLSAQADFETSLQAAVQSIEEQAVSCDYVLSDVSLQGHAIDPNKLNITYEVNGSSALSDLRLIVKATSSSCPEGGGWFLNPSDPSNKSIRLCPSTCAAIHEDAGAIVTARGGCDSLVGVN